MKFYKITAQIGEDFWRCEGERRSVSNERVKDVCMKSEDYNTFGCEDRYLFVSHIGERVVCCGAVAKRGEVTAEQVRGFFKAIDVPAYDEDVCEITLKMFRDLISQAERRDFIDDSDEVLDTFELTPLCSRFSRDLEYGEKLINPDVTRKQLYGVSSRLLFTETLTPELDRIYLGRKNAKVEGHPVHYFVETTGKRTAGKMTDALLQALYKNGRLDNRRFSIVDFSPSSGFSRYIYDALYKSCSGGAIIVRYSADNDSEDDEYADGALETVGILCETMKKYRNRVLTVFCLPRGCQKTRNVFFEKLGDVTMIELKEDLVGDEKAADYLKTLCKYRHVRCDNALLSRVEPQKLYLADELCAEFDEWYDSKLKTTYYPQYKTVAATRAKAMKEKPSGTAYDELSEMIGLTAAKDVIRKALNYYKLQKIYKDKGAAQDSPAMHMVFTGNPGTAKTTVARLFARIMKENGLLSRGQLVECGRCDLVGKYVGWTAQIVKEKFESAKGGVLFIDEAYSLVDDRGGSYGDEAINTIVQEMENLREDTVVIFAGYPAEMEGFLNKNPGLRSRIAFHVPFADYNAIELCSIARLIGRSKGVTLTDGAVAKLSEVFEAASRRSDFGNGRYVRNVIELSKMNQADRIISMDPEKVTRSVLTTIEAEDVYVPPLQTEQKKLTIGFAS